MRPCQSLGISPDWPKTLQLGMSACGQPSWAARAGCMYSDCCPRFGLPVLKGAARYSFGRGAWLSTQLHSCMGQFSEEGLLSAQNCPLPWLKTNEHRDLGLSFLVSKGESLCGHSCPLRIHESLHKIAVASIATHWTQHSSKSQGLSTLRHI